MKDGNWLTALKEVLWGCLNACQKFITYQILLMVSLTIIDNFSTSVQIFNHYFVSKMSHDFYYFLNLINLKNDDNFEFNDFQKNVNLPIIRPESKITLKQWVTWLFLFCSDLNLKTCHSLWSLQTNTTTHKFIFEICFYFLHFSW